uniref:Circadian clock-controlled protein n=1 Tax=Maconellicoccus hirsutus TaxID=177089 RepID=A0AAU6SHC0_MACHI
MCTQYFSSRSFILLFCVILGLSLAQCKRSSKIPDDIHLCKKDDPELNKCLEELFESVRPKLSQGIPEIGLPPMDPLILKEVVIFRGGTGQNMRAVGHDIKITGISNLKINYIKADVENLEISVGVHFPYLRYEGQYDVNARFVNIPVKGKGPMRGNATEVDAQAILKGKFVEVNGEKFVEFTSATVDVDVKDYSVRVEKLFPDKQLNDAINVLINDRKMQSMATAKPIVNKVAGSMMLEMVNRIAKNLSFDEVFA